MIKNLDVHVLERMRSRINRLYGPSEVEHLMERMVGLIGRYGMGLEGYSHADRWDETTAVLITYGDTVQNEGEVPLQVLKRFADLHLSGAINTLHILPFCDRLPGRGSEFREMGACTATRSGFPPDV